MSDSGAVVGSWKTRVKAIKMETSAMDGGSHVWVKGKNIHIGPRRVIPLSRAAILYPDFPEQLKTNPILTKMQLGINYQPTKFYLRTEYEILNISEEERQILDAVKNGRSNFYEYKEALDYVISLGKTTVHSYMKKAGVNSVISK